MTRDALNNSIWTAGLLLQSALIVLVFTRRLARGIPSFTLLLVFYVLRSILIFLFAHRMASAVYAQTYMYLGVTDLFLQLAVAIEFEFRLFPLANLADARKTLRRFAFLLMIPVLAFAATLLIAASLPAKAPIPPDRLQMLDSLFFILLGVLAFGRTASTYLRRVTLGLAVFGMFSVASTVGRTLAALQRDLDRYVAWTYTASIAWLVVVAVWIFTLKPELSTLSSSTPNS